MSESHLLKMSAPVRDGVAIPFHDFGDPAEPPRLALVGGIHGNELNGIFALSRLAGFLRDVVADAHPEMQLCGRIIIVPAVNVLGVNVRRRAWPFDGTDINRMFPGYDAGETTQRIAHAVLTATRDAAVRVDIHSSNLDFEELPQVRLYDPTPSSRATARLFGLPAIIERPSNNIFTATLGHAWHALPGESFVMQAGRAGDLQLEHADRILRALVGFCTRTAILAGTTLADEDDEIWHFGPRQTLPLITEHAGMFVTKTKVGAWLSAGDHIGYVYDAFDGSLRTEVRAPVSGLLGGLRRQPLLCEGDLVARLLVRGELEHDGVDTYLSGHGQ